PKPAAAGKVEIAVLSAPQRKLLLLPPRISAHYEQLHRRLRVDTVGHALEPVIEPWQLENFALHEGLRAKIHVAGSSGNTVLPRSDYHVALLARGGGFSALAHADVSVLRSLRKDVEPAPMGVDRDADLFEHFFHVQLLPVLVVIGMPDPVGIEL